MDSGQLQGPVDSHMTTEITATSTGLINRENIWPDTAAVADQLS
jgi:hypothetical protein